MKNVICIGDHDINTGNEEINRMNETKIKIGYIGSTLHLGQKGVGLEK